MIHGLYEKKVKEISISTVLTSYACNRMIIIPV